MLLLTFEFDEKEMEGPPYAVEEAEVRRLFLGFRSLELLERKDILAQYTGLRDRGLSALVGGVYLLYR